MNVAYAKGDATDVHGVMRSPLLAAAQVRAWRLLCLLPECPNDDNPAADRRDIEGAGYSIAARQPQFPQLPVPVFHVRLAQAFQPCLANTLGEPKEPRLHVSRKGGDFSGDGVVQDFNSPRHTR